MKIMNKRGVATDMIINMRRSILITLGMAALLLLYGYVLSTSGHDHGSHGEVHNEEKQDSHSEHQH